ncbi:MAG: hypothetical protein A2521_01235 [Deltaproteobacteria bacterium RIFOXYD12_FULL_57_12]|nr:MAG: hypothetical protein A2521_01235 [Deltaproteobacteria bacterium RIFOXYD12_FULL_57_12]
MVTFGIFGHPELYQGQALAHEVIAGWLSGVFGLKGFTTRQYGDAGLAVQGDFLLCAESH